MQTTATTDHRTAAETAARHATTTAERAASLVALLVNATHDECIVYLNRIGDDDATSGDAETARRYRMACDHYGHAAGVRRHAIDAERDAIAAMDHVRTAAETADDAERAAIYDDAMVAIYAARDAAERVATMATYAATAAAADRAAAAMFTAYDAAAAAMYAAD